jgi:hypothetical protein
MEHMDQELHTLWQQIERKLATGKSIFCDVFTQHHKNLQRKTACLPEDAEDTTYIYDGHRVSKRCKVDGFRLAKINAHPRDGQIIFDEEPHLYYRKGLTFSLSVTSLLHAMFPEFDEESVITKMLNGLYSGRFPKQPNHAMYRTLPMWCRVDPVTHERIDLDEWEEMAEYRSMEIARHCCKTLWAKIRDDASPRGTRMHANMERYLNGVPIRNIEWCLTNPYIEYRDDTLCLYAPSSDEPHIEDSSPEFRMGVRYIEAMRVQGWMPYRTEQILWCMDLDLAGSVDIQFVRTDPHTFKTEYLLCDWKRYKKLQYKNTFQKGHLYLQDVPDTNMNHAVLQLNLYKFLIERYYDIRFEGMYVVALHPNNQDFIHKPIPHIPNTIQRLFEHRCWGRAAAISTPTCKQDDSNS